MQNVSVTLCDPHPWQSTTQEIQTAHIHIATKECETKATEECKDKVKQQKNATNEVVNQRSANHDSGKQTNNMNNRNLKNL